MTITPELCLAIRGSLRVMVTDDTAGMTGVGADVCIIFSSS